MKLVVAAEDRRVLGVHIVGHGAAEMIQLAAVALRMGATKDGLRPDDGGAPDRGGGAGHDAVAGGDGVLKSREEGRTCP